MQRFSAEELRTIRNNISIKIVIGQFLAIPSKDVEGIFRFLCPNCAEFQTAVNDKTNLARCFRCQKNFNTIEIVMQDKEVSFVEAVKILKTNLLQLSAKHTASCETRVSTHPQRISLADIRAALR